MTPQDTFPSQSGTRIAEGVCTASYLQAGGETNTQAQVEASRLDNPGSPSRGDTWAHSPLEKQPLKQHSKLPPGGITDSLHISGTDSTPSWHPGSRRRSPREQSELHDGEDGPVRAKLKRHVPTVIPHFAHPFVEHLTRKPLFQPTVQKWPTAPKLRRETRELSPSSRGTRLHEKYIHCFGMNGASMMHESMDKTGLSDSCHSASEGMRNGQGGSFAASSAPAGQGGVPSSMSPTVDGPAPTKLTGLACDVHRTTGKEPHALVGATTTVLGDKLYVFGGRILSRRRPHLTSDLYELDLIKRHWAKLETSGDIPPPRYFHSVCALGDTKLVCYGGMSPASYSKSAPASAADPQPEVVVMSDIHIFDVPSKSWMSIKTAETPQGRYAHCATILPSSAIFTSATAPLSAIQHNPSSANPHAGSIGLKVDGAGGAEMVVVGGQDSSNHYIEQISVFNLRSLKWTATNTLGRQCGAYRSVVTPLTGMPVASIGRGTKNAGEVDDTALETGSSMLIYSNYNFLDVKLELQIRDPDGRLNERPMNGAISPPGLRFPNGGIIDHHFVVSGTYLTSSRQEYALWALDLRDLTWGRVDTGGAIFAQGSWNRGVLWNRRNSFVILGHQKRSLVEDYNQRRINFSHVCVVELEAFGLYDNPRKAGPSSGYRSVSSPPVPASLWPKVASQTSIGPLSTAAESLGQLALGLKDMADMDLLATGGERIPVSSHLLSRRWGQYFNRLLRESCVAQGTPADPISLRAHMSSQASRNSAVTITPSVENNSSSSGTTTLINSNSNPSTAGGSVRTANSQDVAGIVDPPDLSQIPPPNRPRTLYLPHAPQTIRLMLHYLYTNSLPPISSHFCTPQILCSVLQLARPYEIDGLLEATVERLHEVLDGRNAAAVLNASAMAAGGGRGLGGISGFGGGRRPSEAGTINGTDQRPAEAGPPGRTLSTKTAGLKIDTSFGESKSDVARVRRQGHERSQSEDSAASASTATSAATSATEGDVQSEGQRDKGKDGELWTGDASAVIGLQKRGLRGLMEGRMLRERSKTTSNPSFNAALADKPTPG